MPECRVLIVDDSALMRELLTEILSSDSDIEVIGSAADPFIARDLIKLHQPNVLTLDVEMPRMDGLTFLEKLMRAYPLPVVMISSLTEKGCETTLRALSLGAIDYIPKPKLSVASGTLELSREIVAKVKAAAGARIIQRTAVHGAAVPTIQSNFSQLKGSQKIIAVGASTGGTEALKEFLEPLPADFPAIAIVQHMPEKFTAQFARRLDSLCKISVKEAADGDRLLVGHALVAPGNHHMELVRTGTEYSVRVTQAEPVNRHRPSVDVLFNSCATHAGPNAIGVILTGMGADGARGLLAMRKAGAFTIAQDESTSVVFGMPKEAIACGGAQEVYPLPKISQAVANHV